MSSPSTSLDTVVSAKSTVGTDESSVATGAKSVKRLLDSISADDQSTDAPTDPAPRSKLQRPSAVKAHTHVRIFIVYNNQELGAVTCEAADPAIGRIVNLLFKSDRMESSEDRNRVVDAIDAFVHDHPPLLSEARETFEEFGLGDLDVEDFTEWERKYDFRAFNEHGTGRSYQTWFVEGPEK